MRTRSSEFKERFNLKRNSFSQTSQMRTEDRKDFENKVQAKMQRIDKQSASQKQELETAKRYQIEQNQLRMAYNQKGKDIEKSQLNSIKERVWKKHKQTMLRRKK